MQMWICTCSKASKNLIKYWKDCVCSTMISLSLPNGIRYTAYNIIIGWSDFSFMWQMNDFRPSKMTSLFLVAHCIIIICGGWCTFIKFSRRFHIAANSFVIYVCALYSMKWGINNFDTLNNFTNTSTICKSLES